MLTLDCDVVVYSMRRHAFLYKFVVLYVKSTRLVMTCKVLHKLIRHILVRCLRYSKAAISEMKSDEGGRDIVSRSKFGAITRSQ